MDTPKKKQAIPLQGSLGLLAQGAIGLRAWRKAIEAAKATSTKKPLNNE